MPLTAFAQGMLARASAEHKARGDIAPEDL